MDTTTTTANTGPASRTEEIPPRVLLTVEAAAQRLSISRTRMYALIKTGDITSVRVGRLRRIPTTALDAYTAHLVTTQHAA